MKLSRSDLIFSILQRWKIISTDLLVRDPSLSKCSDRVLQNSLSRLRKRGLILSVRIGKRWFHFHHYLKRWWSSLSTLSMQERTRKYFSSGLDHHLKVLNVGRYLEGLSPTLHITANVLSDRVSFSQGSQGLRDKKYVPDLTLSFEDQGNIELAYIEVERTLKKIERYRERWLAYEIDNNLNFCLYWVSEPYLLGRLTQYMLDYFYDQRARSNFSLAILLDNSSTHNESKSNVLLFNRNGRYQTTLKNLLSGKNSAVASCWVSPSLNAEMFNYSKALLGGAELTPLPLPSHSNDVSEVAKASVRGVSSAPPSPMIPVDGRGSSSTQHEATIETRPTLHPQNNLDSILDISHLSKISIALIQQERKKT